MTEGEVKKYGENKKDKRSFGVNLKLMECKYMKEPSHTLAGEQQGGLLQGELPTGTGIDNKNKFYNF